MFMTLMLLQFVVNFREYVKNGEAVARHIAVLYFFLSPLTAPSIPVTQNGFACYRFGIIEIDYLLAYNYD